MGPSPEKAPADNKEGDFTQEEEREITRKWYNDTSFEGRTKAEFEALREEVRKSTTLDLVKREKDRDYSRLIYENPLVNEFIADDTVNALIMIYEDRASLGLSENKFQRILAIFGSDVQRRFREEVRSDIGEFLRQAYKQFTPEEIRQHENENLAVMKKEIELQEQNIRHPMLKPTIVPRKKKPN